ncbi:hypothetical protein PR202_ga20643 [Eleusine coracana subsp. coracana]|uniref:Uncharacterized protein n=1 Tax=Eleusine coracana subsp. coracana TaxID=191504 RepID=A0AAV5CX64_ELECO|nr:hypothetical protein PR202_ga20643 [Eleusine coracana subsp. coracana]
MEEGLPVLGRTLAIHLNRGAAASESGVDPYVWVCLLDDLAPRLGVMAAAPPPQSLAFQSRRGCRMAAPYNNLAAAAGNALCVRVNLSHVPPPKIRMVLPLPPLLSRPA